MSAAIKASIVDHFHDLARLLPFCEAWDWQKSYLCWLAVRAIYAAGARAYRIVSCNDLGSFENGFVVIGV
jgi:hypothetical protein